jgi:membrane protein
MPVNDRCGQSVPVEDHKVLSGSEVIKERFLTSPVMPNKLSFPLGRSLVEVMSRPPASRTSTNRTDAASSSMLWRILFGIVAVVLTSLRSRGSRKASAQGRPIRGGAGDAVGIARERKGRSTHPGAGHPAGSGHDPKGAADGRDAAEPGRGRNVASPTDIPAKGWKDILWRTYEEVNNDRILAVAAGVTFYSLLALFPAVAALVSIYGLFADAATIQDHLNTAAGFLPGGALDVIGEQVKRITSKGSGTLGLAFFSGLAISLWSANAGMKAMFDALNVAYDEEEQRGFIALNLRSLAFTLGAILFIVLALVGVVVVPVVLNFIGLGKVTEWIISIARWPALLAVIVGALAVLYRYGPSRSNPQWRWITPGSIVAAIVWVVGSMLFSWYVSNFGNYNETYGSLGAAVGFMTWIWLSTTIVLVGAEMNAEIEHQTAHDTTETGGKPLGARGARMADTIGAAKA